MDDPENYWQLYYRDGSLWARLLAWILALALLACSARGHDTETTMGTETRCRDPVD